MSIFNYINDINEIIYQIEYELNYISNDDCEDYKNELLRSLKLLQDAISSLENVKNILLN